MTLPAVERRPPSSDGPAATATAPEPRAHPGCRRSILRPASLPGEAEELRLEGLCDDPDARRPPWEQCRRALDHGAELLATRGGSFDDIVRLVCVLRDPDALAGCLPMLRACFSDARPAVALRVVPGFDRPGIEIELDLIAHLPPSRRPTEPYSGPRRPV